MIEVSSKVKGWSTDSAQCFAVIYIGSNEIKVIATQGVADVALFNKEHFSLLIGWVQVLYEGLRGNKLTRTSLRRTAVFAFEGIGL